MVLSVLKRGWEGWNEKLALINVMGVTLFCCFKLCHTTQIDRKLLISALSRVCALWEASAREVYPPWILKRFQRWLAQVSRHSAKQKSALHQALQKLPATEVLGSLPAIQSSPHCPAQALHLGLRAWSRGCALIVVEHACGRA